jgi:hypothetical protein
MCAASCGHDTQSLRSRHADSDKKCLLETARFNVAWLSELKLQGDAVLGTAQDAYLVVVWITLSVACLVLLNSVWHPSKRRVHNDVIGWQVTILGTIYAVMIGFMLLTVWSNLQDAEKNADNEANSLVNLFRTADGLPAAQRNALQIAAANYCNAVLTREWLTMSRDGDPNAAQPFMMQMWKILTHTPDGGRGQQASVEQAMNELSDLTRHRRVRILEARSQMPTILWAVLVVGGVVTIASCCMIGSENAKLHLALILAISLLISFSLIAILDIDRPFQGSVHVSSEAFVRAQHSILHPEHAAGY